MIENSNNAELKGGTSNDLYTLLPAVIKQIDTWIESSEMTAETFRKAGLDKEAQTFVNYAQAYWNIKQFIEVNGG